MLQNKGTKYLSEISSFFSSEEKSLTTVLQVIKGLNINRIKTGLEEYSQASYRKNDLLLICLLFPIFSIENVRRYIGSSLHGAFLTEKDTFYRLKNNPLLYLRAFFYKVIKRILVFFYCDIDIGIAIEIAIEIVTGVYIRLRLEIL